MHIFRPTFDVFVHIFRPTFGGPCHFSVIFLRLLPELFGGLHGALVHIARLQQGGIAVADFALQFGIAAEMAQVVAGKGVAQGILGPAVSRGVPPCGAAKFAPVLLPVWWADAGGCVSAPAIQYAQQRRVDGDPPRAARLAVLRANVDGVSLQIYLIPGQACYFVRAYARV